ncbi:MAG: protein TolQ, partial [Hyphomonas sp.]
METEMIGPVSGHADFSLFSLLMAADPVVKLVLVILFAASVWSWIVIGEKFFKLNSLKKQSRQFEEAFWSGRAGEVDPRSGQGGKDP